jgi:outer membrane protein assembly factor BamB
MSSRLLTFLLLFPLLTAAEPSWPQWRGPLGNGTAPKGEPPIEWGEKTNLRWKADIPGRGASTPIVWDDQVFLLTALDTRRKADPSDIPKPEGLEKKTTPPETYFQFLVIAYDRSTGKERWRRIAAERVPHEGHHPTHSYAAGSPCTDGKLLYASFGSFGLYCYDLSGNLQWKYDLGRMETRLGWGEANTPVIHGDNLIVNCDQERKSFLVVLDARTGKPRWKVDRDEPTSWSTPLVTEHNGRTQVITPGTKQVRSYDLANGNLIWEAPGLTVNVIPSSVRFEDHAICMSGYRGSMVRAIPLSSRGVLGAKDQRWQHDRGTPYVPSPVLVGDRLYFTQNNEPVLSCLDADTGKVIFDRQRIPRVQDFYSSPVAAAGRLYFVDRKGTGVVLKAGDKVEVLATNQLGEGVDASPALAGNQLFLRGDKHLFCFEGK